MARRGWVAAEVAPDRWMRLMVFDDGWVELPGFARGLSDTRRQLRTLLKIVAAVVVLALLPRVADLLGAGDTLRTVVALVAGLGFVGLLVLAAVVVTRQRLRDLRQSSGDLRQARAARQAGERVRLAPGAPRWRRASTAAELDAWLEGVHRVDRAALVAAEASQDGDAHVVTIRLSDGTERVLRSPDDKLPELVLPLAPGAGRV